MLLNNPAAANSSPSPSSVDYSPLQAVLGMSVRDDSARPCLEQRVYEARTVPVVVGRVLGKRDSKQPTAVARDWERLSVRFYGTAV